MLSGYLLLLDIHTTYPCLLFFLMALYTWYASFYLILLDYLLHLPGTCFCLRHLLLTHAYYFCLMALYPCHVLFHFTTYCTSLVPHFTYLFLTHANYFCLIALYTCHALLYLTTYHTCLALLHNIHTTHPCLLIALYLATYWACLVLLLLDILTFPLIKNLGTASLIHLFWSSVASNAESF